MKIKIKDKNIRSINNIIFNEDCFDTMKRFKDNEIDIILTSPPYNTSRNTKTELARKNHWSRYDVFVDTGSHENYVDWSIKLFNEFDRVLVHNGVILYNINYGTDGDNSTCNNLIDTIHSISANTNFMVADIIVWKKIQHSQIIPVVINVLGYMNLYLYYVGSQRVKHL